MKGWKKIFHANGNKKKTRIAILIFDKIDFKTKTITINKEVHYIIIKKTIQEENITFIKIFALNQGATKFIKQILTGIQGESDSNTIVVGKFNTPFTSMDRSSRQKISK